MTRRCSGARFTLMRRIDRLSATDMAELAALFARHPHLGAALGDGPALPPHP